MKEEVMIQHLQNRFSLFKATVIYSTLEEHFAKEGRSIKANSPESMEVP